MQYMLLIYDAPDAWDGLSPDELESVRGEYFAITQDPSFRSGAQLQPATTATTVRVDNGSALTTDGPFTETKELLGGFYIVEAASLDDAVATASRIPAARMGGAVEVRPLVQR